MDHNLHPTQILTGPSGEPVPIDILLVPVIEMLWALGLTTVRSCQDVGEAYAAGTMAPHAEQRWSLFYSGQAWLRMPRASGQQLLTMLADTELFAPRLSPFTDKTNGGWQSHVWLGPNGLANDVNIYFPSPQITQVTETLGRLAARTEPRGE
jgi:hypothetical protein